MHFTDLSLVSMKGLYTEGVKYTAGKYLMVIEFMPGKYRKHFIFSFNYSVWMNTFLHTVDCVSYICACG